MSSLNLSKLRLLFTLIFTSGFLSVVAQNSIIQGLVTEQNGNTLAGATVKVQELNKTTVTDNSGHYSINVSAGTYTLVVSYTGESTQSLSITLAQGEKVTRDVVLVSNGALIQSVVVVGTRNLKRTATESAVPLDVIPLKQLSNQVGQLDLTQLLTYLAPSFNSVRQALGDGTDHIDPAQLRGLGPDQVLVLVNGKRYHQSSLVNVNGTVNRGTVGTDLNSIPASAVERIEILRDGAAAQYGSDAIAGVINIVLKRKTGLSVNTSIGENVTSYDKNYSWNKLHPTNLLDNKVSVQDGQNFQGSINYGIPIKKGYLELTAEYLRRNSTNRTGLYTGQIWPSVGGVDKSDSINSAKGLTRNNFDLRVGNSKIVGSGYVVNFSYPITQNLDVYVFGIANFKDGNAGGLYRYPNSIRAGSSFPSANTGSIQAASIVQQLYPIGFLPVEDSKVSDYTITGGLRGKVGSWNLDVSETFGGNSYKYLVSNSVNYTQAYLQGVTFSSLQTSFNSGKTKTSQAVFNVDLSKNHKVLQGLNTAFGQEFRVDSYSIVAGEFNSYADLTNPTNSSANNSLAGIAGAQVFAGFLPENSGTWYRSSVALYSDNELDITKNWLVTGALRFENFSDFGSTLNYKFSTRYKISDRFALRGSASSGFRAPSLQQQHYSKVTTQFINVGGILSPVQAGTFTNDSKIAQILGIPRLKQETSHSYSLGGTAKIARGLDLTVDVYQIDIKNRIILSNSFNGGNDAQLTAALNAAGAATASVFANGVDTRSRGLEAVLSYNTTFGNKQSINISIAHSSIQNRLRRDGNGNVIIHGSDVLVKSGQLSKYFNRLDQSRIETQSPQIKDVVAIQYKNGKFGTFLRFSYFGKITFLADSTGGASVAANAFDNNLVETIDQEFGGKLLTDLSFNYAVHKNVTVSIGANNLFDTYPDKQTHYNNTSTGRFTYSRAVSQFGYNGRYLFAKVSLNL